MGLMWERIGQVLRDYRAKRYMRRQNKIVQAKARATARR